MKHLLIILSLLLAGSANCQEQDTALLADTATTLLSDEQLYELGKKDGLAKVGKGASPFFSSEAYMNGWNEGTQMQSVGKSKHLFPVLVVATITTLILAILIALAGRGSGGCIGCFQI